MNLLVISPTPNADYASKMVSTARRVGIEPLLYGFDSNHPHGKDYQGTDIVRILQTSDAPFVMGVDAPDVCFLAGVPEIMAEFSTFKHPFVVSAEHDGVTGMPKTQDELLRQCSEVNGHHAQLNIGCWIGKREYALECFTEAERLYKDHPENPEYSYDNHFQYLALMKAWSGRMAPWGSVGPVGPEFHIDTHCRIFQSMNKTSTVLERGKRVRNRVTDTRPCVLHYNGDPTRVGFNAMVGVLMRGE